MNSTTPYTPAQLFEIFREQHRLTAPLDIMADPTFVLTPQTKVWGWRGASDMMEWDDLARFLNQEFRIDVPLRTWKTVLTPEDERTLGSVCDFLATVARREVVTPIKRLGAESLAAAAFLAIKKNLASKGVDVAELRPSTPVTAFLEDNRNFSPLVEEATLTGVRTFDVLQYGELRCNTAITRWIDWLLPNVVSRRPIETGDIKTFRDLAERIAGAKPLGGPETA